MKMLVKASTFKSKSLKNFNGVAYKLGLRAHALPMIHPKILIWNGPVLGETCLSIDRVVQNDRATRGGIICTYKGKHISNFYSYYGPGINNLVEIRALLDGTVYCKMLGITIFHIHTDSEHMVY